MAVKHYYCGKVCFNCIITVQNIKTYFNQSHKLLAIHTFVQYKFGHTVSETSLELQQFCLLLLCCETYYIISGLVRSKAHQMRISFWTVQKSSLSIEPLKLFWREHFCFHSSRWCYETFFGGNLENLDFPLSWKSILRHLKSNKQF